MEKNKNRVKGKNDERERKERGRERNTEKDNNGFNGGLKWPGFKALVRRQAQSSLEMKALD